MVRKRERRLKETKNSITFCHFRGDPETVGTLNRFDEKPRQTVIPRSRRRRGVSHVHYLQSEIPRCARNDTAPERFSTNCYASPLRAQRWRGVLLFELFPHFWRPVVGLGVIRKMSFKYVSTIMFERLARGLSQAGIRPHELGARPGSESEQIMHNQHLAVTVRTRADADRRDAQPASDQSSQFARNTF